MITNLRYIFMVPLWSIITELAGVILSYIQSFADVLEKESIKLK
jgi:hypothetical protein